MKWINTRRVYDKPLKNDGCRILIDRLWPRGISKEAAAATEWEKALAPTTALRQWFGHDPARWPEFKARYIIELKKNDAVDLFIKKYKKEKIITLIYAAKDEEHNHALVLQEFLENRHHED